MLKVIIIDDENLAIEQLASIVKSIKNVKVVDKFLNGYKALEAVDEIKPDIVFLDIHMPEISGIELAEKIMNKSPETNIIFVTGYEQYALKAFEIGVTDYILKPFKKERIEKVIERLLSTNEIEKKKDEYAVCCFKYFHFTVNGVELKNVKWRTAKAKELFVYLIQNSKEIVRKDILIELLWPKLEVESAYDNLYTTIYHLRKTLEDIKFDIKINNTVHGYEIQLNNVKYDVSEWKETIAQLDHLIDNNNSIDDVIKCYNKAIKMYKGDYLAEESYIWKENEQEKLRVLFMASSRRMIDYLMEHKEYTEAILLSLQIQDLYPYLDYSYFMLMQLYDKFGDMYNVERQYTKLKQVLEEEFNTKPNQSIRDWYHDWMKRQHIM